MGYGENPDNSTRELNALRELRAENARLRAALCKIVDLDHHNHGPESNATKIARAALSQ